MASKLHSQQKEFDSEKTKFEEIISQLNETSKEQKTENESLLDQIKNLELFNEQLTDENNNLNEAINNQKTMHESQLSETMKDQKNLQNVATLAQEILSKFFMIQIQNDELAQKQLKKTEVDLSKLETDMKKSIDDYYSIIDSVRRKSSLGPNSRGADKLGPPRSRTARPATARRFGGNAANFGNFGDFGNDPSNTLGSNENGIQRGSIESGRGSVQVPKTNLVYEMQTMTLCLNTAMKKLEEQNDSHLKDINSKDLAINKLKSKNLDLINSAERMDTEHSGKVSELEKEILELRENINILENEIENVQSQNKQLKKQQRRPMMIDSVIDDGNTYLFDNNNSSNASDNDELINQIKYLESLNKTGFVDEHYSEYQAQEIPKTKKQLAPWRTALQVGSKLDCMDDAYLWWTSEVIECDKDRLKVRYDGFDARWDDWVQRSSTRIAQYLTRALGGRETRGLNVKLEIVTERDGKNVFKQGWLTKQGGTFKSYKIRFFVLYGDGTMQYFKQMTDTKPTGGFNIKNMTETRRINFRKKNIFGFEIVTPKRTWRFQCDSEQQVTDWISVIHAVASGLAEKFSKEMDNTYGTDGGTDGSLNHSTNSMNNNNNNNNNSMNAMSADDAEISYKKQKLQNRKNRNKKRASAKKIIDNNMNFMNTMRMDTFDNELEIESLSGSDMEDMNDIFITKEKKRQMKAAAAAAAAAQRNGDGNSEISGNMSDIDREWNLLNKNKDISSAVGSDLAGINEDASMFGIPLSGNEDDNSKNGNNKKTEYKAKKDPNIEYEGWMYKQGRWQANWTLRYCKLYRKPAKLQCYTDRKGKLTHEIDLSTVLSFQDIKQTKNNIERLQAMEIPTIYAFQMVTPGRTYTFACKSEIELNLWTKHTKALIQIYDIKKHMQSSLNNGDSNVDGNNNNNNDNTDGVNGDASNKDNKDTSDIDSEMSVGNDDQKMQHHHNVSNQPRTSKSSFSTNFGSFIHKTGKNLGRMIGVTPEYVPVTEVMTKEDTFVATQPTIAKHTYFGSRDDRARTALVVGSHPLANKNNQSNTTSYDDINLRKSNRNNINGTKAILATIPADTIANNALNGDMITSSALSNGSKSKESRRKSVPVLLVGKNLEVFLLKNGGKLYNPATDGGINNDSNDSKVENTGQSDKNTKSNKINKNDRKNRRRSQPQTRIELDMSTLQRTLANLQKEYETRSKSRSPPSDVSPLSGNSSTKSSQQGTDIAHAAAKGQKGHQQRKMSKSKSPRGRKSRKNSNSGNNNNRARARTRSKSRTRKNLRSPTGADGTGNNINNNKSDIGGTAVTVTDAIEVVDSYKQSVEALEKIQKQRQIDRENRSPLNGPLFPAISEEDSKLMDEYARAMSKSPPLTSGTNSDNTGNIDNKPDISLPLSKTKNVKFLDAKNDTDGASVSNSDISVLSED